MTSRMKLRQLLTQSKPPINCRSKSTSTYVNEDNWPKLRGHITLWADFNIGTLTSRYGKLLEMEMEHPEGVAKEKLENLTIHGMKDIKQIIAWNASILEPALQFGQSQLPLQKLRIVHEHTNPHITAASSQTRVDHLIELKDAPTRTLVVGLGATSIKFRGGAHLSRSNQKNKASREENLMRQLAHACDLANSRYGYIQTNDELVACRFSCTGTVWEAEIMPIPMELSGDQGMTTALAIWWMAMLAMPKWEDSDIRPREKMAPLDGQVATKKRKANDDPQASVTDPDGNSGRMAGPSPPSGPNMEVLDTNAGIGGSLNSASHNASFANVPNMGLLDTAAGVGGIPDSASCNAGFPSFSNPGLADNSIGSPEGLNSEFETGIRMSDFVNFVEDVDELQRRQS
ncbi:unnamed protein product [Clonostachys rhizophaga]|uniref:Uncharacterized protein n=1 Tax=Clonostachys rhizophaga TaxID=160324 RepID=A0A9N9VEJ8_9HYPO|nr:unnamed protein product [Clonostachys rhizophaga]